MNKTEETAELMHNYLCDYLKMIFDKSKTRSDNSVNIPSDLSRQLKRLVETKYKDLPKEDKDKLEKAASVIF